MKWTGASGNASASIPTSRSAPPNVSAKSCAMATRSSALPSGGFKAFRLVPVVVAVAFVTWLEACEDGTHRALRKVTECRFCRPDLCASRLLRSDTPEDPVHKGRDFEGIGYGKQRTTVQDDQVISTRQLFQHVLEAIGMKQLRCV